MSSAATRFASLPEMLNNLSYSIINRDLLRNLCLVNKRFKSAFAPSLYEEVWFRAHNTSFLMEKLPLLLGNQALRYTQKIDLAISLHSRKSDEQGKGVLCDFYNQSIQALLSKMPQLNCFRWEYVPLYTTTLATLQQNCPNLRTLVIHHPEDIEEILGISYDFNWDHDLKERRPLFAFQDLGVLSGLTTIEVSNIHGDLEITRKGLVQTLLNSPSLKTLALSISGFTVFRLWKVNTRFSCQQYQNFLDQLCRDFFDAGGKPLQLQKLVLGLSIIPWGSGDCLRRLTNLVCLEDVYIFNEEYETALTFSDDDDYIAWSLLTPENCPNLTNVGAYRLTKSVERWIGSLTEGFIKQFNTEWATEEGVAALKWDTDDTQTRSAAKLRSLTFNVNITWDMSDLEQLPVVNVEKLQALSAVIVHSTPEHQTGILEWLSRAKDLEQLFFAERCCANIPANTNSQPDNEGFEYKLARQCKKLRYLRLDQNAWRITRYDPAASGLDIQFERLDRFETRLIEEFQPRMIFREDW
ncbi:hypothetical protein GLAREA_08700 [Glarea lozoyensis ATCC 20868]|uniref:Uncharacterized protein n=1 Tax=Glarea lozoyensis (strain ATCC 20868 / MF5171) TaxID=1116229 RepID=S3DDM5_GLAL2|nr:uncharacterized protein GLAREA_08700 [Glarea lozoyensis ATCC 20868]EPE36537.1 hypothetical protein GLAREA_08700 [Glarea lozoyensis ATCC 20868]